MIDILNNNCWCFFSQDSEKTDSYIAKLIADIVLLLRRGYSYNFNSITQKSDGIEKRTNMRADQYTSHTNSVDPQNCQPPNSEDPFENLIYKNIVTKVN